jgi:tRNA-Thr(GGU) m(6)t(6)A37 methyltransferase TsaA
MPSPTQLTVIGVIHSPFREPAGTPIQPAFAQGAQGTVEVFPEYAAAIEDLDGFERIWLLYWFDRAPPPRLRVVPFRDEVPRGLFATRAPCRPNPIGLSSVRLLRIECNRLTVADVDMLDGTPVLDIKPYVPEFDAFGQSRAGWLDQHGAGRVRADRRFESGAAHDPKTLDSEPG